MDSYIMSVVKQLVQLASVDEDLKAEIDSLDSAGFSLLHYCCLYNLNSLIPVLLARGASVHRKADDGACVLLCPFTLMCSRRVEGSTPLHLAVTARNMAVCRLLIESGANIHERNDEKATPRELAEQLGFTEIQDYLLSVTYPLSLSSLLPLHALSSPPSVDRRAPRQQANDHRHLLSEPHQRCQIRECLRCRQFQQLLGQKRAGLHRGSVPFCQRKRSSFLFLPHGHASPCERGHRRESIQQVAPSGLHFSIVDG